MACHGGGGGGSTGSTKNTIKAEVIIKHWYKALAKTTRTNSIDVLLDAADKIRGLAEALAPMDTGALKRSIAIVSQKRSDYSRKVAIARRLRPRASIQPKPLVGKDEVFIIPVVGYAGFQEYGTKFHGAQPFLIPAVRTVGMKVLPRGFGAQVFGQYKKYPPIVNTMIF